MGGNFLLKIIEFVMLTRSTATSNRAVIDARLVARTNILSGSSGRALMRNVASVLPLFTFVSPS